MIKGCLWGFRRFGYLCCNLDKYELFLHQRIKEAFGEEVDRTIQIERKQFGDKVVEALVVPASTGWWSIIRRIERPLEVKVGFKSFGGDCNMNNWDYGMESSG